MRLLAGFMLVACLALTSHAAPVPSPDPMHTMAIRMVAWSMAVSPLLVLTAPDSTDQGTEDSLRLNSGDPTNTDIPTLFLRSPTSRRRLTPLQQGSMLPPPGGYRPTTAVDSLLRDMRLREVLDGYAIGPDITVPFDDYIRLRREEIFSTLRDSSLSAYEIKRPLSGSELTRLLEQATNLTIPLPPLPVLGFLGKPEVSINVNGEVNVQAGWRWDTQQLGTASVLGQTQSAPIFNQNIQVNVSGRIGDKLRMNVDWNTLNQFEFNNRFKIGYEGYDDDIIKKVEFGNVSLETPSTLIGGGQALFGVRSDYQFGPLYLKTIISQRRAERQFVNARGGSSRQYYLIRAYNYSTNHFFLDTNYFQVWRDYFASATPTIPASAAPLAVKEIEVWESTNDVRDVQATEAIAFDTITPVKHKLGGRYGPEYRARPIRVGATERGRFMRLKPDRYVWDPNLGTVTITSMRQDRTYAVGYRTEGPTATDTDDDYHGMLTSTSFTSGNNVQDTLILKLIYRPSLQPGFRVIWARQMKNRYNIGVPNVNPTDSKIGMWYFRNTNDSTDVLQGAPDKIPTIFRIDQVNNGTGAAPPDGVFDARPPVFDATRGEITFPSLEPFRAGIREYFRQRGNPDLAEQYVYNEVYDTTFQAAQLVSAKDRFVITAEATGSATGSRVSLNAYNVAPNSVKVTLDGVPLREGADYTVDYYQGYVNLLNPRAVLPNANLNVEFEKNDIFNLTTRTLVGLRADMLLFSQRKLTGSIGMTMMNYDQAAVIDRVQPGQEPNANFMLGFDTKFNADIPWLTRALDDLPFFDTKEKSTLTVQGEWALVAPDPNKRLSTICSDNNKAVAYLDDFESARRNLAFGITPALWSHSSAAQNDRLWPDDTTAALYRGRAFWYQKFVPDVPQEDIYPQRARIQGRANYNPMRIVFNPRARGIYNKNPEFLDSENPRWFDPDSIAVRQQVEAWRNNHQGQIWGGMMRLLSAFNTNFDNENVDYIEIMMKIDYSEPGSKMYIDLGQISEDIIPNQRLDTEDKFPPNNLIDEGEDSGIDTLFNAQEQLVYPDPLNRETDPARDDYQFNFGADRTNQTEGDFVRYNNFEGNATQAETGTRPNTEILNTNNGQTISLDNSYFRYEINLNPDPVTNPQIVGGNPDKGWVLYRIPVRRPDSVVGSPLFTNIQYVRMHFQGGEVKLSVADWGLVGTYWLRAHNFQSGLTPADSVLQVAYVSREENSDAPDYYTMPPCVTPARQLQNPSPNQDIFFNEQSLVVRVNNLRYGEERMSVRIFRPQDLFYYKEMAFFIHGDQTMPDQVTAGSVPPAQCFIRFGVDSANYYEYRRPLTRGWQDLRIILAELTAIKQVRNAVFRDGRQEFPVPNDPLATFVVRGSPILTRVQFVGFGIANPMERFPNELTTTMWVDELRLVDPVSSVDWAGVASASLKLADLADITTSFNHSQPNFHRLEERFGNRREVTNWNVNVTSNLEKFLPKEMKDTKIPIVYSHTEVVENPQFQAQNDVELDRAAEAARADTLAKGAPAEIADAVARNVREASQTVIVRDQWALTGLRLGLPTKAWYVDDIFNKLTFNYSYAQEFQRTQVVQNRFDWRWQLRVDYAVTIPARYDVKPTGFLADVPLLKAYKDMKINFLPSNIALAMDMQRQRITEQSRFLDFPSPIVRSFYAQKTGSFTWKLVENGFLSPVIDYKVQSASTLVPLELDADGRQRTGGELFSQMFLNEGSLFNFGEDNQYNQTITISMRPRLPDIFGLTRFLETTGSYNVVYSWFDPLQPDPAQRDIVKNARYTSTLRFSPVFRWRQFGNEIFGAPKRDSSSASIGGILQEIFFGFENLTMLFSQGNTATNNGVLGGTGFSNLWARTLTFRGDDAFWGPSTAYQLGLVRNPHGSITLEPSSAFPFFRFGSTVGLRPANGVMMDDYSQKTTLQLQTSRPLWPGATLDLQMKSDFGFSRNQRVITDAAGVPSFANVQERQTLDRTFISLPSFAFLAAFNDNMQNVVDLYSIERDRIESDPTVDTNVREQRLREALSQAFVDGFESLQLFTGELARIMPALNWTLRWDGIEKFGPWKGIAQRIYLEHAYQSNYMENARVSDNGRVVEVQQIQQGFKPLIGLTMNFDEKALNGTLTANIRYNTTTAYNLNSAAGATVQRDDQRELQIQASYLRRGFSLKFLGLDLQNDLELTFLTQLRQSKQLRYDILRFNPDGDVVQGTTQITFEPRARYTISNRVTASAFVRYEGNFSEGASNPGYSTTQVGVDIRLSISGGR